MSQNEQEQCQTDRTHDSNYFICHDIALFIRDNHDHPERDRCKSQASTANIRMVQKVHKRFVRAIYLYLSLG